MALTQVLKVPDYLKLIYFVVKYFITSEKKQAEPLSTVPEHLGFRVAFK